MPQPKPLKLVGRLYNLSLLFFLLFLLIWMGKGLIPEPQPTPAHPIQLYSTENKNDIKRVLLRAMQEAKKSIDLGVYTCTEKEILKELQKKQQQGVDVRFIVDGKGTRQTLPLALQRKGRGLFHQKLLVIDETVTFLGSANFTSASFSTYHNHLIGIFDKELAKHVATHLRSLQEKGPAPLCFPYKKTIGAQTVELWLTPHPEAEKRLDTLLKSANKCVRLAMYTFTHQKLAETLTSLKAHVSVVLDEGQSKGCGQKVQRLLHEKKIPTHTPNDSALMHHKLLWIDDKQALFGSLNWTQAAFSKNDEVFLLLEPLTEEQQRHLSTLWQALSPSPPKN